MIGRAVASWLLVAAVAVGLAAAQQVQPQQQAPPPPVAPAKPGGSDYKQLLLKKYLSNEELAVWADEYLSRCSVIARKFSIGKSVNGLDIWGLEISNAPGKDEARPNFKYLANMHGDEPSGRMLLPMLAEWLCDNRGKDKGAVQVLSGMHLYLLPTVNPDGFTLHKRVDARAVDLNRNFPDPIYLGGSPDDLRRPVTNAAPETAAIMNFTLSGHFSASANLHEGAVVANYPWDGYPDRSTIERKERNPTPDDATFVFLAKTYAAKHKFMAASKEFKDGIVNGAEWYPVYGGMQDWNYVAAGCMAITLELSEKKWRPEADLPALWEENRDALVALPIAAVLAGLRGEVTDASTGAPLAATLRATSAASRGDPVPFYSRKSNGFYARPLAPGKYKVMASAPGYVTQEAEVKVPEFGFGATLDFKLKPAAGAGGGAAAAAGAAAATGGEGGAPAPEAGAAAGGSEAAAGAAPAAQQRQGAGAAGAGGAAAPAASTARKRKARTPALALLGHALIFGIIVGSAWKHGGSLVSAASAYVSGARRPASRPVRYEPARRFEV